MANLNEIVEDYGDYIAEIALESIASGLTDDEPFKVDLSDVPLALKEKMGCFVSVYKDGKVRGCMGVISSENPLIIEVANMAFNAVFTDKRFSELTAEEIGEGNIKIVISVVGEPQRVICRSDEELISKITSDDGLVISEKGKTVSFLPEVWQTYITPQNFVNSLKSQIGLDKDYWSDTIKFYKFKAKSVECEIPPDEEDEYDEEAEG